VIDEISLIVAPIIACTEDKPLFMGSIISNFELKELKQYDNGIVWMNYKKAYERK